VYGFFDLRLFDADGKSEKKSSSQNWWVKKTYCFKETSTEKTQAKSMNLYGLSKPRPSFVGVDGLGFWDCF